MNDRDFFMALVLATASAGSCIPVEDAKRIFEDFKKMDSKGHIPHE